MERYWAQLNIALLHNESFLYSTFQVLSTIYCVLVIRLWLLLKLGKVQKSNLKLKRVSGEHRHQLQAWTSMPRKLSGRHAKHKENRYSVLMFWCLHRTCPDQVGFCYRVNMYTMKQHHAAHQQQGSRRCVVRRCEAQHKGFTKSCYRSSLALANLDFACTRIQCFWDLQKTLLYSLTNFGHAEPAKRSLPCQD